MPEDDSFNGKVLNRLTEIEDRLGALEDLDFTKQIGVVDRQVKEMRRMMLKLRRDLEHECVDRIALEIRSQLLKDYSDHPQRPAMREYIMLSTTRNLGILANSDDPEKDADNAYAEWKSTLTSKGFGGLFDGGRLIRVDKRR